MSPKIVELEELSDRCEKLRSAGRKIVAALQCVDLATIFPEIRATKFLAAVRPAVYVKGGDYTPGTLDQEERAILKEIGSAIRLIPFEIGYSTSGLIEQICTSRSGQTQ